MKTNKKFSFLVNLLRLLLLGGLGLLFVGYEVWPAILKGLEEGSYFCLILAVGIAGLIIFCVGAAFVELMQDDD